MISLKQAISIVNAAKEKNKKIQGIVETDLLYVFTVETDEDINDHDYLPISHYVTTVNKQTGELGSMTFLEYCDAVNAGQIRQLK